MRTITNLQNAIILSSIIGSLMSSYNPTVADERKKPIDTIRRRIKKFMFTRSRTNKDEFLEAIKISDAVWREAIHHFKERKLTIDVFSTVVNLYNLYEQPLSKFANIHSKQIETYAYNPHASLQIEQQSNEVSDYIIDKLSDFTGIKRRVLNLLKRIAK